MTRVGDMASRLPLLYREGPVVEGILGQPAQQIEIAGEDALLVQRSHFFDDALELDEVARLASLLDFEPEPWQSLALFRPWVHAQRDAVLKNGAVTVDAIEGFAAAYADAFQQAAGAVFPKAAPRLVEFPDRRRYAKPSVPDDTAPLSPFAIVNAGLDDTFASVLLTGVDGGPESMPLIANLTTGDALLFHGTIATGQRLWIKAGQDGSVSAQLERADVTPQLVSIAGLVPGVTWERPAIQSPARALPLVRGENALWFLPVAHYEERGLDRVLLALADLALSQGRWDGAVLDHALFYMDPAVNMRFTWLETEPASIELHVHAETVHRRVPAPGTPADLRSQLASALDEGLKRIRAVGVRSQAVALSFAETQGSFDFMTGVIPLVLEEAGATGADRLPDKGGVFGVTGYGDSTFR